MGLVRIGLLTTANINRKLLGAAQRQRDRTASTRSARATSPRAEAYAEANGIARAHGSYEELLADPELDAVYIALPNTLHHEWTLRALAAGKHVLCEKPFSRRPEQVEQAWDEAARRGLVVMEAFMWRHSRQTALMLGAAAASSASCRRSTPRSPTTSRGPRTCASIRARRRRAARRRLLLRQRRASARRPRARPRLRRAVARPRRRRRALRRRHALRRGARDLPVRLRRAARARHRALGSKGELRAARPVAHEARRASS